MLGRPIAAVVVTLALLTAPAPAMADGDTSPSMEGETSLAPPEGADAAAVSSLASLAGVSAGDVPDEHVLDTSSYMFGSAYLQVVFLESDGSEEPESEDWTASQKQQVLDGIRNGMDFWENQAPDRLSFSGVYAADTVHTGVEPIRGNAYTGNDPCQNQWRWMGDVMKAYGMLPGDFDCSDDDYVVNVWAANIIFGHELRNAQGTDWAFTVYVVDSENDGDGMFADGKFAYAARNGPYMVLTYDNDGWGIDRMDRVAAHETGHIFGATDEYNGVTETWGYLWEQETPNSGCIMDDSSWCVSSGSAKQIGWRDSDSDGLADPLDTVPDLDARGFQAPADPTSDATPDLSGEAADVPYPAAPEFQNYGYNSISVNDVTDVTLAVDGTTTTTSPSPADPHLAPWSLTTDPLADGTHQLTVSAANQVGGSDPDPVTREITVDTTPPTVTLVDPAPGQVYVAGQTSHEDPREDRSDEPARVVGSVIELNATASDALTGTDTVAFYLDGKLVDQQSQAPYRTQALMDPFAEGAPGEHTATVVAIDEVGNSATASQPYVVPPAAP